MYKIKYTDLSRKAQAQLDLCIDCFVGTEEEYKETEGTKRPTTSKAFVFNEDELDFHDPSDYNCLFIDYNGNTYNLCDFEIQQLTNCCGIAIITNLRKDDRLVGITISNLIMESMAAIVRKYGDRGILFTTADDLRKGEKCPIGALANKFAKKIGEVKKNPDSKNKISIWFADLSKE